MKYILETERLMLREFTFADTTFIVQLLNSPGWLRFIGDRNVKTDDDAIKYLENGPMKSYAENGYGLSMVETKDGTPVGMSGILKRPALEHPDIGFAFLPEHNGKGYGFEIASAILKHAVEHLDIKNISAITVPDNLASIRLLEKLGLKYVKDFSFEGSNEVLRLYTN